MCGICGIVGKQMGPESEVIVGKMMQCLSHRGPDDEGQASSKNHVFGHRRLAIIDIENGKQPMLNHDGSVQLVFNGEIYNYIELRQELKNKGVRFETFSDTEVLLRCYEMYGPDCVNKLNGMFAFAIFDQANRRVVAARDHFGIKPFYFTFLNNGTFIFASEIKALFTHPECNSRINQKGLNEYLTFQFCLGEKTLFKDIYKLEPANLCIYSLDTSKLETRRYWELSYEVDTDHTEEYFIDKLQFLLKRSINEQLRSDVAIGGYLSGGLDSSSVVTLAAEQYGNKFQCFTGRFAEGPEYDESHYARSVANSSSSIYNEIVPTAHEFIDTLPKLIYHMDEPAAGPGLFPQYIVSKMAKEHVTVVLGGQGGDEIFGGYARYLVAYLEQSLKGSIFENQEEGKHIVTLESIIPNLPLLKNYVPMLGSFWETDLFAPMDKRYFKLIDRSRNLKQILHPQVWERYNSDAIFNQFQKIFNQPGTTSYFNKMTWFDQQTLLPALLQVEDRVSMAVSLESRVPLLDRRIAELMASMPPVLKFQGGKTKYALKKAMVTRLPKEILDRKDKMGFPVPLSEWWNGPLRDFVGDTILSKRCRERGMFNTKQLESLVMAEGKYGRQVWGVLCLELWMQAFFDA